MVLCLLVQALAEVSFANGAEGWIVILLRLIGCQLQTVHRGAAHTGNPCSTINHCDTACRGGQHLGTLLATCPLALPL